jgi:ADP-heptose:LPS heptosyltransferase
VAIGGVGPPHTQVDAAYLCGFFRTYDLHVKVAVRLHACDRMFEVPAALGCKIPIDGYVTPPTLSEAATAFATRFREELPRDARILAVHPDTSQEKCWRPELYREVLDIFLYRCPQFFAVIVGRKYENLELGRYPHRILSCFGLPLDFSVALVAQADLFLGVDSSMLHAADLFRVPGVGLFGPDTIKDWGFRFSRHVHVVGRDSAQDISAEAVLDALLLAQEWMEILW